VPAFAQDYPQIELGFGYANLGANVQDLNSGRHSGFATHQSFNLSSWLAIENYLGYYTYGKNPEVGSMELITNSFGGRVAYRADGRPMVYASAGIGGGWIRFKDFNSSSNNAMSFRFGGGVDIPIGENFAWKVEVSRMSFHFFDAWQKGTNVATGIVLKITQ
jgi:opacity protein-like surface antigen